MKKLIGFLLSISCVLSLTGMPIQASGYVVNDPVISDSGVTTWDCIYFGSYYQSSLTEKEPIKWRILDVDENDNSALILADCNLDCRPFHTPDKKMTWADSTVRYWLNNDFLSTAFNETEFNSIYLVELPNEPNPDYGTDCGDNTLDYVFLLSADDVTYEGYGFNSNPNGRNGTRKSLNTVYSKSQRELGRQPGEADSWMLRTNGYDAERVCEVGYHEMVSYYGSYLSETNSMIRPALYIDLSSTSWKYAGSVQSNGVVIPPQPIDISSYVALVNDTCVYNGTKQKPMVTVDGLVEGVDYTVTYSKNTNAGTANVLVTGINDYTGTIQTSFVIEPALITKMSLSSTSIVYDGKSHTPSVTVKSGDVVLASKVKASNSKVTIKYASGRTSVGKYKITATGIGNYTGSDYKYLTIRPKSTQISSITPGSKRFTLKWTKQATQTTGYEVQYDTSSKFSNPITYTTSKNTTVAKTFTKLNGKKKYYVRIRTYKTVKNEKIYSSWSTVKTVTTKA